MAKFGCRTARGYGLKFSDALAAVISVCPGRRDHLEHTARCNSAAMDSLAAAPAETQRRGCCPPAVVIEELHTASGCFSVGLGLFLGIESLRLSGRPVLGRARFGSVTVSAYRETGYLVGRRHLGRVDGEERLARTGKVQEVRFAAPLTEPWPLPNNRRAADRAALVNASNSVSCLRCWRASS